MPRPRRPHSVLLFVLVSAASAALTSAGCGRESCEASACVESCGGPEFLSCGPCPTGSFAVETCLPPGDTSCVAYHDRPEGTCDDAMCMGDNPRCLSAGPGPVCTDDECTTSADCTAGEVCACNAGPLSAHVCVPADCASSADCGGLACRAIVGCHVPGSGAAGLRIVGYRCATATDECASDADCAGENERCNLASAVEPIDTPFRCIVTTCE